MTSFKYRNSERRRNSEITQGMGDLTNPYRAPTTDELHISVICSLETPRGGIWNSDLLILQVRITVHRNSSGVGMLRGR
jgi:hypothetical protein